MFCYTFLKLIIQECENHYLLLFEEDKKCLRYHLFVSNAIQFSNEKQLVAVRTRWVEYISVRHQCFKDRRREVIVGTSRPLTLTNSMTGLDSRCPFKEHIF